jgi:hypothetical protein
MCPARSATDAWASPGRELANGARSRPLRSRSVGGCWLRSDHHRCSWAEATAWKVPAATCSRNPSWRSRCSNSPEALRVNVRASVWPASPLPTLALYAILRVRTRVLPAPAEARTHSGAEVLTTAARCEVVSPASKSSVAASSRTEATIRRGCDGVVDPLESRTRLRAWWVIPPNHPAGAATGCLSMPGVCPDPSRSSSICVAWSARRHIPRGRRSRGPGPPGPPAADLWIRLPLGTCGTPDGCSTTVRT